jgi:hypothetical protein
MFMRFRATLFLALSLMWFVLASGDGRAQNSPPTEYQIKAAFLFNFARFVQWPPKALADATSPMVIGVLGENPFHDDLERTMRGKSVDEHPLVVKEFHTLAEATNCHILFISASEKTRLPQILKTIKGSGVLTVGEMDHFTENGGMINFVMEGAKIRFQINNDAATSEGLKISSKLLALAFHPEH